MADGSQVPVRNVRVGLIEDAPVIAPHLGDSLRSAGYLVDIAASSDDACFDSMCPSVLVLDLTGASHACLELLRSLRCKATTQELPIIVVSGKADEDDIIRALEAGADDFMSKPISVSELIARVEALLRRLTINEPLPAFSVGDIEFDRQAARVRRCGKIVEMGPTDMRVLELFLDNPGKVLDRQTILDAVWGRAATVDERTIDVHVGRLRKALHTSGRDDPITTLRGAGYRFDPK